ncbi:hypothetical protein SDC9_196646 [bioreactor metagenome]|uniref:Uncharacterized protein n=1 Tax=bioreactor metagenome TaxID=1076179 RepID=A0A645IP63_9ZZZZ
MAVSFFTETNLAANFLLRTESFVVVEALEPLIEETEPIAGTAAVSASCLVILPSFPEPETCSGVIPFSSRIFLAAGEGVPAA